MKNFTQVIVTILLLGSFNVFSQWTTDPANPLVTAQTTNVQSNVQSFPDGNGGLFTFWRDSRILSGKFDIYGQHYNSEGIAQWASGGKVIIDGVGNVTYFHIIRTDDGDLFIGWIDYITTGSSDNGIFAQKLDSDGETLWPTNLVMKTGNSLIGITLVESAGAYYSVMQALVTGGADKIYINKFTENGNLLWPLNAYNITYNTGDIGRVSGTADELGGIFVYYSTANAWGASVLCNHLNASGGNLWPEWINVTVGSPGLNGPFSAIGDFQGVTFSWVGDGVPNTTGKNVYSRRLSIVNGNLTWTEGTRNICVSNGNQDRFYWKKSGEDYFITWSDSRPGVVGNSAIYAQKFNISGEILWEENGVQVANLNTYIPNPEFDLDAENTMVIAHKASSAGFFAHKVHLDGTIDWGLQGRLVFTNNYSPFYEDFNILYTGNKFLAISARTQPSGGADGIYISQICSGPSDCSSLNTEEFDAGNQKELKLYPNPGTDHLNVTLQNSTKTVLAVSLYDINGKLIKEKSHGYNTPCKIYTSDLASGVYILVIKGEQDMYQTKWLKL